MYTLKETHIISLKKQIFLFFSEAFSIHIYIYIYIYIYTNIYLYIYIITLFIYICVFFCRYISSHTFKVGICL